MRKFYLLAFLLGLVAYGNAQSFSVRPSNILDTTLDAHTYVDAYIYFDNEFQQPLSLAWEETNQSFPGGWLMTVCDNASCYNIPHPGSTMTVAQGASGFLKVTCTPQDIGGTGTVSYHVYDANNPIYSANVTFNFNAVSTGVSMTHASELFTVTPVPANNVIHLTARNGQLEKGNVQLFDLKGQLVLNQAVNAVQSTELDVQTLTPGMYLLRYDSKAGVLNQKVVVAH